MRRCSIIVALLALLLTGASKPQPPAWHWQTLHSEARGWSVHQGVAKISMADGKISGKLYIDAGYQADYALQGTYQFTRARRGKLANLNVEVETFGTDYGDPTPYRGTYRQISFDNVTREVITLTDTYNVVAIVRNTNR